MGLVLKEDEEGVRVGRGLAGVFMLNSQGSYIFYCY